MICTVYLCCWPLTMVPHRYYLSLASGHEDDYLVSVVGESFFNFGGNTPNTTEVLRVATWQAKNEVEFFVG